MFRDHIKTLRKKLKSHIALLRRLVGSGWVADAKAFRIAALNPVYSTSEYCAPPVWYRSTHTRLIDSVLNDAVRVGKLHYRVFQNRDRIGKKSGLCGLVWI